MSRVGSTSRKKKQQDEFLDEYAHSSSSSNSSSGGESDEDVCPEKFSSSSLQLAGVVKAGQSREFDINSRHSLKKFSSSLLATANNTDWEPHEVANLGSLIFSCTNLKPHKLIKLIFKCGIVSPMVISCLDDLGISTSNSKKITILRQSSRDLAQFTGFIGGCLEEGLFSLKDSDVIKKLVKAGDAFRSETMVDKRGYIVKLCSYADTKETCGALLHRFMKKGTRHTFTQESGYED